MQRLAVAIAAYKEQTGRLPKDMGSKYVARKLDVRFEIAGNESGRKERYDTTSHLDNHQGASGPIVSSEGGG